MINDWNAKVGNLTGLGDLLGLYFELWNFELWNIKLKNMIYRRLFFSGLMILNLQFVICNLRAQSVYPGQHEGKMKVSNTAKIQVFSFDLKDIRLTDSPFKQNMKRTARWLTSLDVARLLHSFRTTAGVYAAREGGYDAVRKLGGWESLDCELRGHTTGHVLSALSYLYASTGDMTYKIKSDSIIDGLAAVQNAYNNGYISAFPENFINRNIAGQSVWAPWYTLHKIYAGLIDQYLYCGNNQALEIVVKAADWAYDKLKPLSDEQRVIMLRNEFGGVNDAFYNLYSITANPHHKWLAEFFYHAAALDPLAEGKSDLAGKHANTFIPKITGEMRRYELSGEERSRRIAEFFWREVVEHQTFCTGGNSSKEHFIPSDSISKYLTGLTQESCNTYNMLKLTRHLYSLDPSPLYADYYETALYNHILGQQDPSSGMVAYFLPLLPGAHKVYSTPENSFWCCVGTGFENHAKYGEAIYAHGDNSLYVNLFIPSELTWKDKGLKVSMETRFPEDGRVSLKFINASASQMSVYLRYPSWATGAVVKINGKRFNFKQKAGSYIVINRKWKDGDRIDADYERSLQTLAANDDASVAAFAYGPLILAAHAGTDGMQPPAPFSNPALHNDYYTYDYHVPSSINNVIACDPSRPEKYLQPVAGQPLTFKSHDGAYTFEPLYKLHRERYIVYWIMR
jgi:DUF1680 family protein